MFFTKKGDDGTTSFFSSKERVAKNSARAEALGALDEINSLLGVCKIKAGTLSIADEFISEILEDMQQGLFIVQAAVAGAPKEMAAARIEKMEHIIQLLEKAMPPVASFFVAGGTEDAALFDFARTVARRAERRFITWQANEPTKLAPAFLQFLNRLSSLLYAFARYANFTAGAQEKKPHYHI